MTRTAILIVTYLEFDFLVQPLLKLINHFWLEHPPIFITGTNKNFNETETISIKDYNFKNWVSTYYESLKFLQQQGFDSFYLILDDIHPIGKCDANYLNLYLPQKAEQYNAGYVYLMEHFSLLKASECQDDEWLHIVPKSPYSISLQFGYWHIDYALSITDKIQKKGIINIWNYEIQGSFLDLQDNRPNFIFKEANNSLIPNSKLETLPEKVRWHVSRTPYPFVRGGFLYQGRSTRITRRIYNEFVGEFPEVKQILEYTNTPQYHTFDLIRRVKKRIKSWELLFAD
ncbi:MAG: hypothetical protein KAF91_30420 [Nostoc sp. TH1S01]|nr:hypothetical protein [Nostoc sp. TH1S01]